MPRNKENRIRLKPKTAAKQTILFTAITLQALIICAGEAQNPKSTASTSSAPKSTLKDWRLKLRESTSCYLTARTADADMLVQTAFKSAESAQDQAGMIASLNALADFQILDGKIAELSDTVKKALDLALLKFGAKSPQYALELAYLSSYFAKKGELAQAREKMESAQAIINNDTAKYPLESASIMLALARRQKSEGSFGLADDSYAKALSLKEAALGAKDPSVLLVCKEYADLLDQLDRKSDSEKLKDRIILANAAFNLSPSGNQENAAKTKSEQSDSGLFIKAVKEARQAESVNDYPKAVSNWKLAVAEAEKSGSSRQSELAFALLHLADASVLNKDNSLVIETYKRSLALREKLGKDKTLGMARNLSRIGNCYVLQQKYSEAEPLLRKALQIEESNNADARMIAATLQALLSSYMLNKNNGAAEEIAKKLLSISEKITGQTAVMYKRSALATIGSVCLQTGRLQEGMKTMQEVSALAGSPAQGQEISKAYTDEYREVDKIIDETELKIQAHQ